MDGSGVALVVAAVVVFAFAGWVVLRPVEPTTISASQLQPAEPATEPSAAGQDYPAVTGDPPRLLAVGDSYAAGVGAATPDQGYVRLLADSLGWEADVKSEPGGGYGKPGIGGKSVLGLLRESDLESYDVILIQSGYNDVSVDDARVADAASAAARLVTRVGVPVIVVGEFWPGRPTPSSKARAETIAQAWEDREGVLFLDPIGEGWSDFATADDRHPDTAGHALIARRIESAVRRAGIV